MPHELPQQPDQNILERQLDALCGMQMNDLRPEVKSYLQNLITQAQGILASHKDLNAAPIETLQTLQSLITKLKHVAKTKEVPPEDNYTFTIKDAINPNHEVYQQNGLPSQERITRIEDLKKVLELDRKAYQQSNLPEWAQALPSTFTIPPESRKLIETELKAGAIPIFMPGAQVQQQTLLKALTSLKPTWIKEGEPQTIKDPYIWEHIQNLITVQDPTLIVNIPDKPYILLVKPTQKPPEETTEKTLEQQKAYLAKLQEDNPNAQSILPQEYAALQVLFTQRIQPSYAKATEGKDDHTLTTLDPLDKDTYTRFITLPVSPDNSVPDGYWNPAAERLNFNGSAVDFSHTDNGFRLSVRAEIEF